MLYKCSMWPWGYCTVQTPWRVLIDCFSAALWDHAHLVPSLFKEKLMFSAHSKGEGWSLCHPTWEPIHLGTVFGPHLSSPACHLCSSVVWLMLGSAFPTPLVQQSWLGFGMPEHPEFSRVTHEGPHPISGCVLAILGQTVQTEPR